MTQLFDFDDIIGKTIKSVKSYDEDVFIVFDDDSFTALGNDPYVRGTRFGLQGRSIENVNVSELGLLVFLKEITLEQADARIAQMTQRWEESAKRREIQQLQELKAKYPDV